MKSFYRNHKIFRLIYRIFSNTLLALLHLVFISSRDWLNGSRLIYLLIRVSLNIRFWHETHKFMHQNTNDFLFIFTKMQHNFSLKILSTFLDLFSRCFYGQVQSEMWKFERGYKDKAKPIILRPHKLHA